MTKTTVNGNLVFHATVKSYLPPVIEHDFVDDEGELQYALANGNTIPANRYNAVWNPGKGIINWKAEGNTIGNKQAKY